jgi:hypothetical protein
MTITPSLRYSSTPGRLITVSLITDYFPTHHADKVSLQPAANHAVTELVRTNLA